MSAPSPSFCILPWMHVFADEQGVMWPCCRSVSTAHPNRDEAGTPVKIGDGALMETMNTQAMRALRRDMLDGREPAACERCYMVERVGILSHRQEENARRAGEVEALVAATAPDGRIDGGIRTADIRLGNTCNLRCRMCSPHSSRKLIPEWAAKYGVPMTHEALDAYRGIDWFEGDGFWSALEAGAPELERVNFAGGEPLLIPAMTAFLERMVAEGRAGGMTITYNTNLTLLPDRVLQLWPHFAAIRVTGSIDGFGAVNAFIRYPAKWRTTDAHLRRLDREYAALNLAGGLSTNTAVQVLNAFRLGDLLDYFARDFEHLELPNLSIVTHPGHLSLRILPPALKALAADRLHGAIARSAGLWRSRWGAEADALIASIEGVVTYMHAEDHSHLLPEFLTWARHQDAFRRQDTASAIPELAPLFEESIPDGAKGLAQPISAVL